MSKSSKSILSLSAMALVSALAGQTTHIVDASGGAGTFRTITEAVNAAVHGDTIIVRAGGYGPPDTSLSIGKGIAILAERGAVVRPLPAVVLVSGIPAGRRFVLDGLLQEGGHVSVSGSVGEVVLCNLELQRTYLGAAGGVELIDCRQVSLRNVRAYVMSVSRVADLVCYQSEARGACNSYGCPGFSATDSKVSLVDTTVNGGWGFFGGAAGIGMVGGELTLSGKTVIAAGLTGIPPSPFWQVAVAARGGSVTADPAVQFLPLGGAPDISGAARVRLQPVPFCTLDAMTVGNMSSLTVDAPAGSPFCAFLAPADTTRPTPFGTLWFDPAVAAIVATGLVGSLGRTPLPFPVPTQVPPGSVWVGQAGVLTSAGAGASEPALVVTR